MKDASKKIYIIIAAVIIIIPSILMPFFIKKNDEDIQKYDQRFAVNIIDIVNSADKTVTLESYFSDHLPFRSKIISLWANLNYIIDVSCREHYILVGEDEWLFLGNQFFSKVDHYRNIFDYESSEVDIYIQKLTALDHYLANKDIDFLFTIAPEKESIYPEKLPKWVNIADGDNFISSVMNMAEAKPIEDAVLDLRPIVNEKKDDFDYDLYYKSDAHWSTLGAYFGYEAIIDKLIESYDPNLKKIEFIDYKKVDSNGYVLHNTLGMIGNYNDFKTIVNYSPNEKIKQEFLTENESWDDFKRYVNRNALNDKKVLIIRDSFTSAMESYFYNTFSEFYVAHYYKSILMDDDAETFKNIIDTYNPDIVIIEGVERIAYEMGDLLPLSYKD